MSDRPAKGALFDAFASVAQALESGRRAEIVDVPAQGERSVDEVTGEIGQSLANTSHRLSFADASLDVVISNGVIDLIPDKDAVFSELKPSAA